MKATLRAVAVLIAALALSGGAAAAKPSPPPPATAVTAQADTDVGNDRPQVSYDGLMVRRRVVLAIHSTANADLASLREQLDLAATGRHTTLSTMSASTLDPAVLDRLAPDLVVALPLGATRADAGKLMNSSLAAGGRIVDNVEEVDVIRVLVHDLRFTVAAAHPAVLAKAISREGILADALGNYTATLGAHRLRIAYTGPLLSDHLVQSVRIGIARPAHTAPRAVTVSPRSTTGTGVDMAKEPAPAPAAIHASVSSHNHGATAADVSAPSHLDPWPFPALGLFAALALTFALLRTKRVNRSNPS
ncbi:MAG: hypothetical protein QOF53_2987 [Nocardioidaceae bacterium]|nr:hypothetical protein [Nocardioidaceae bacterium]